MNVLAIYHSLMTNSMDPCFLNDDKEARRTWLCPGCLQPRSGVKEVDVRLQERVPRDKPLNFVYGGGVGLIHRQLLEMLDAELVQQDLYIGRAFNNRGKEIEDWVTFRGRRSVIIRGTKDAGYRDCPECGRHLYAARGKRYLYPAPATDAVIFGSQHYSLVVPPHVYEKIAVKTWRKLRVEKLPVLTEPIDGLGVLSFSPSAG